MKERPIIFSTPMVRAILEGRKTQTRRVVKPDIANFLEDGWEPQERMYETRDGDIVPAHTLCPFGQPGDRLWVRETWQITRNQDPALIILVLRIRGQRFVYSTGLHVPLKYWDLKRGRVKSPHLYRPGAAINNVLDRIEKACDAFKTEGMAAGGWDFDSLRKELDRITLRTNDLTPSEVDGAIKWYHNPDHMKVVFRADADPSEDIDPWGRGKKKWRPSIHMPRAASRILLEITDVRVDRLHEITQEDAMEEGFELTGWRPTYNDPDSGGEIWTPKDNFIEMWEKIYGPESWEQNPWVWVISFKKIEP